MDGIPVCVEYMINSKITNTFPETYQLNNAEPVYEYLDGWKCNISDIYSYSEFPEAAKKHIEFK